MTDLVTVPREILETILPFLKNTPLESKISKLLKAPEFPAQAKVERVIDGDTIVLSSGTVVRYVGITSPENHEAFDQDSTEFNKKLVENKTVQLEYDSYKADKFGRILAYVISNGKNVSVELAKHGLAQAVIYQKRKPFIYQDQILKAQSYAKRKKLGMWSDNIP